MQAGTTLRINWQAGSIAHCSRALDMTRRFHHWLDWRRRPTRAYRLFSASRLFTGRFPSGGARLARRCRSVRRHRHCPLLAALGALALLAAA